MDYLREAWYRGGAQKALRLDRLCEVRPSGSPRVYKQANVIGIVDVDNSETPGKRRGIQVDPIMATAICLRLDLYLSCSKV